MAGTEEATDRASNDSLKGPPLWGSATSRMKTSISVVTRFVCTLTMANFALLPPSAGLR